MLSIQRYVLLEEDRQAAAVFGRDHGDWAGHAFSGDTRLLMPEIGVSLSLNERFPGVELVLDDPDKDPSWAPDSGLPGVAFEM